MPKYGYARCSTGEKKQDVERQIRELTERGVDNIYQEYASGAKSERKVFTELTQKLQPGDTLSVTEVSRLSRSLHQLCHIAEDAKARQIRLECGNLTLDYTENVDPMNLAMYQIMGAFAELERGLTVERIKSGLKNAKEKGAVMGRPKKTAADVPQKVRDLLPGYLAGEFDKTEYAKKAGITRPSLYKYLRLLGNG